MHQPNALVIGPMKAGTTWLHDFLEAQGNVCLPAGVKETFYFDRYYNKGDNWYCQHFAAYDAGKHARIMEIAPSYFHSAEAAERMRRLLGDIPLVITLRDPVKRSWSHYLHLRRYGYTSKNLQQAAQDHPQLLQASCYAAMLQRWQQHFSAENLHVIWQEDLQANPEHYAMRFCQLLDIPFAGLPEQARQRSNEAAVPPSSAVAALGRKFSYALRERGLYNVVNIAKKLGLKRFFFGTPGNAALPVMTENDASWLAGQLQEDFNQLAERYRHPDVSLTVYTRKSN